MKEIKVCSGLFMIQSSDGGVVVGWGGVVWCVGWCGVVWCGVVV